MGAERTHRVKVKVLVEREAIIEMSSLVTPEKGEILEALKNNHCSIEYISPYYEDKIVQIISDPVEEPDPED